MQAAATTPTIQHFTLTLTGYAHDKAHIKYTISTTLTGAADGSDGKLKMTLSLWVNPTTVGITPTYGTFSVAAGYGYLVQKFHFIWLSLRVTGKYGAYPTVWYIQGRTGNPSSSKLPISLSVSIGADKIILPVKGSPQLYDVDFTGTLTLT